MKITTFKCDENLSQYVDSMLFDSGTHIAMMRCDLENAAECSISLEVRGYVKIYFGEDSQPYKYPSEFPKALKELIRNKPNGWQTEPDVYADETNWFEYIYTVKTDTGHYSDGVVCEWDISKGTAEEIKKEMLEICEMLKQDLDGQYTKNNATVPKFNPSDYKATELKIGTTTKEVIEK